MTCYGIKNTIFSSFQVFYKQTFSDASRYPTRVLSFKNIFKFLLVTFKICYSVIIFYSFMAGQGVTGGQSHKLNSYLCVSEIMFPYEIGQRQGTYTMKAPTRLHCVITRITISNTLRSLTFWDVMQNHWVVCWCHTSSTFRQASKISYTKHFLFTM